MLRHQHKICPLTALLPTAHVQCFFWVGAHLVRTTSAAAAWMSSCKGWVVPFVLPHAAECYSRHCLRLCWHLNKLYRQVCLPKQPTHAICSSRLKLQPGQKTHCLQLHTAPCHLAFVQQLLQQFVEALNAPGGLWCIPAYLVL